MLLLSNDCSCSKPAVHPRNWKTISASTKKDWYIHYRFHDPQFPKPKLIIFRGMNHVKDLHQRRILTQDLLDAEIDMLENKGYNPITKQMVEVEEEFDYIIGPQTPFIRALTEALKHLKSSEDTQRDARHVMTYIDKAACQLRKDSIPISMVRRRHLIMVLDQCRKTKEIFTANTFNAYRSNLLMLFSVLVEMETIDVNPVKEIRKERIVKKIRATLSAEERQQVNDHLKKNHYRFWLYLQAFFHSGSRSRELFRLQGKDIDLPGQRIKLLIKKRKGYAEEILRPIKDIAVPYWTEIMQGCRDDDYIFSRRLKPGPTMNKAIQISRRWRSHVKAPVDQGGLGIHKDFYALKHLNIDETAEALSIKEASRMASHTTPVVTMEVYAVGEKKRQAERLKKVNNAFA